MDLTSAINNLIIFIIYFVIFMLILLAWWFFIFVLFAPAFRNRKLKKLIREDMQEYNEILADKARVSIEKANTQLQYDKLVIQKSEKSDEIKAATKELENTQRMIVENKALLDTLAEFIKTPQGQVFIQTQAQKQIIKEQQSKDAESKGKKSKSTKDTTENVDDVDKV